MVETLERTYLQRLIETEDRLHTSAANPGHDVPQVQLEAKVLRQALHGYSDDVVAIVTGWPQPSRHAPHRMRSYGNNPDTLEAQSLNLGLNASGKGSFIAE